MVYNEKNPVKMPSQKAAYPTRECDSRVSGTIVDKGLSRSHSTEVLRGVTS